MVTKVYPPHTGNWQQDSFNREVAEALNGLLAMLEVTTVTVSGITYPAVKFGNAITLYVVNGAWKAIGGSGTTTTVASA